MRSLPVIVGIVVLAAVVATAAWLSFRPAEGPPVSPSGENGTGENGENGEDGNGSPRSGHGSNGATKTIPGDGQARVPEPEDLTLRTIELLVVEGESERAIRALGPHIERAPDDPAPRRLRGRAFLNVGNWRLAERDFAKATGLEGEEPTTTSLDGRAEALIHVRQTKRARELLDRSLEREPDRARVHSLKALSYLKDNDPAAARDEIDRALALDPSDPLANGLKKRVDIAPR